MRPIEIAINRIELHLKTYTKTPTFATSDIYDRAYTQGLEMAKLIAQLVDIETKYQCHE